MKYPRSGFFRSYRTALIKHLDQKTGKADPRVITHVCSRIPQAGLPVPELAELHQHILVMDLLPACPPRKRPSLIRNAGQFFAATITASGSAEGSAKHLARLGKSIESMSRHSVELAAANRQLGFEIIQCGKVEAALRKSETHSLKSLEESESIKKQLRELSRRILSVQEEERKKISRELHDVVAQALLGINVRLSTLKKEAGIHTKGLGRNITLTQRMIMKSANIVHQFARELRPAVLDDLGLVSALESFMKNFTTHTGIRTHLVVCDEVEKIDPAKRIVFYRVAQEALTNVARHAHASRVDVTIRKEAEHVIMKVVDDGRSFQIEHALGAGGVGRLGLLGMRERVEMVGGNFAIESAPGKGTTVIARIPSAKASSRKRRSNTAGNQPNEP